MSPRSSDPNFEFAAMMTHLLFRLAHDQNETLRISFGSVTLVRESGLSRYIGWWRIRDLRPLNVGECRKNMRFAAFRPNDVFDTHSSYKQCITNQRTMAAPGNRFGAH